MNEKPYTVMAAFVKSALDILNEKKQSGEEIPLIDVDNLDIESDGGFTVGSVPKKDFWAFVFRHQVDLQKLPHHARTLACLSRNVFFRPQRQALERSVLFRHEISRSFA
jgi:hypothetical protein